MSTNFFLVEPGAVFSPDYSIHVGKRAGDSWSFQGHRDSTFDSELTSWAQYKRVIRMLGSVWTEYGVAVDAEAFIAEVEAMDAEARSRQHAWVEAHAKTDAVTALHLQDCWLDGEGYSFTWADFI